MTPLWRTQVKAWWPHLRHPKTALMRALLSAKVFDLRGLADLLPQTAIEIHRAFAEFPDGGDNPGDRFIDLGETAVVPAPSTWLEVRDNLAIWLTPLGHAGYAVMAFRPNYDISHAGVLIEARHGDDPDAPIGLFHLSGYDIDHGSGGVGEDGSGHIAHALAALAVINSPAALRSAGHHHKGATKGLGLGPRVLEGLTPTVITLGRSPRENGGARIESHPKAYHFCRAHSRNRLGRKELVRAHWRGDPAFGIRIGSYRVLGEGATA